MYKFKKITQLDVIRSGNRPFAADYVFLDTVEKFERAAALDAFFAGGGVVTKCPTKWAHGALRFGPGWDAGGKTRSTFDEFYVDSFGEVQEGGEDMVEDDLACLRTVDAGVVPPNLDPLR